MKELATAKYLLINGNFLRPSKNHELVISERPIDTSRVDK